MASKHLSPEDYGQPVSVDLTNATALPVTTGIAGLASGVSTFLTTPSSANLASALTSHTGSGDAVFANSPVLVTPNLDTPSALVGTNISGVASGLTAGKTTISDSGGATHAYVVLANSQTGDQQLKSDADLGYNATTNALSATTFIGALNGNADTVTGFSGTSSGTNTGDQTTVSGNAGTATALQTARTINGVSFDGTGNIVVTAAGSTLSDTVTIAKGGTGNITGYAALDALTIHGADIASATTLDLDSATGYLVDVTGTTTITAITLSEGRERLVRFTGILTLTRDFTTLELPGSGDITTADGDYAHFVGYAGGVVKCIMYQKRLSIPFAPNQVTIQALAASSSPILIGSSTGTGTKQIGWSSSLTYNNITGAIIGSMYLPVTQTTFNATQTITASQQAIIFGTLTISSAGSLTINGTIYILNIPYGT